MSRKDLPTAKAPNFSERVRETLMTYMGKQGDKLDRGLTLRDMISAGLLSLRDGYSLNNVGAGSLPLVPGPGMETYKPDYTPPPTPTGFGVSPGISVFFVEHDTPSFLMGHGYLRTNVYAVTHVAGAPLPTFNDAVKITSFTGVTDGYPSDPATTWRVWVKWETQDNVESAVPAGGTNGLAVTTGVDVAKLVTALTGPDKPFKVVETPYLLPDGTYVPVGTYMSDAFIHRMQVQNAMISDAAITNAKVQDLSASKLTTGSLQVGSSVSSANYVAGTQGWKIDGNGNIEARNGVFHGAVYATSGTFAGSLSAATGSFAGDISAASGTFNGGVRGGAYTGYAWPAAGGKGYFLGPGGFLLGNRNSGRWFQYEDATGYLSMPGLEIVNGNATFSGVLSIDNGTGTKMVIDSQQVRVYVGGTLRVQLGVDF